MWFFEVRVMGMKVFIKQGDLFTRSSNAEFPRKKLLVAGGGAWNVPLNCSPPAVRSQERM